MESRQERNERRAAEQAAAATWLANNAASLEGTVAVDEVNDSTEDNEDTESSQNAEVSMGQDSVNAVLRGDTGDLDRDTINDRAQAASAEALIQQFVEGA